MHIFDLAGTLPTKLSSPGGPFMGIQVVWSGMAKRAESQNADGSYNYSAGVYRVSVDITDRIPVEFAPRIVSEAVVVPDASGRNGADIEVSVPVLNPDGVWSATQDGGILDRGLIHTSSITISLVIDSETFVAFQGRVLGPPKEIQGRTIFTIRGGLVDVLEAQMKYEVISGDQRVFLNEFGVLELSSHSEGSGISKIQVHHPIVGFDFRGQGSPVVSTTGDIDIRELVFFDSVITSNSGSLGEYEIEFLNDSDFVVSGPGRRAIGSRTKDLETDWIKIRSSDWIVRGENIQGSKITFQVSYTVSGNPISIIKRVLEHGILGTWGNATTEPDFLPIDWDNLNWLEELHASRTVFVSETNTDNSVFLATSQDRPLTVKRVIDRIAAHLGLVPVVGMDGKIRLTSLHLKDGQQVHPINQDMIEEYSLEGGRKPDFIQINYGADLDGNMKAERIIVQEDIGEFDSLISYSPGDIAELNGDYWQAIQSTGPGAFTTSHWLRYIPETKEIDFPYFKKGVSETVLDAMKKDYQERIEIGEDRIVAKILPAPGVSLMAGDVARIELSLAPARTFVVQIERVSKILGGEVSIEAQRIPDPLHALNRWCAGTWCDGVW